MGCSNAPEEIMMPYHVAPGDFQRIIYVHGSRPFVFRTPLLDNSPVDGSIFTFLDDVLKFLLACSAAEAGRNYENKTPSLTEHLTHMFFLQNEGKQESIGFLQDRREARRLFAPGLLQGKVCVHMRELGALLSPSGSNKPEREARIGAANKGWNQLQCFWTASAPYRVKRIAFISRVMSAALSGLEAFYFTPADAKALDITLVKKLRAMM